MWSIFNLSHLRSSSIAAIYKHFKKDSSVGNTLLPAIAFLNLLFTLSIIFVVYITRLISNEYLKNAVSAPSLSLNSLLHADIFYLISWKIPLTSFSASSKVDAPKHILQRIPNLMNHAPLNICMRKN